MNAYIKWNLLKIRLLGTDGFAGKLLVANPAHLIPVGSFKEKNTVRKVPKRIILIVDNEPNILHLLQSFLSPDYVLVLKKQAMDAIHWLEAGNRPVMVITEYHHRHFSSGHFLSYIRSSGFLHSLPIIILTEVNEPGIDSGNLTPGIAALIRKPFNPVFLKHNIKAILHEFEPATA